MRDSKLAVLVNSIVGGTPAYRREFVAGDVPRIARRLRRLGVAYGAQPQVSLFWEARYLLANEADIRDSAIYHAVLGAIASGNATRGGIASYVGRKSPDIGHLLAVLEDSRLIAREIGPFRKGWLRFRC